MASEQRRSRGDAAPPGAADHIDAETFELAHEELQITFEYQVQRLQEIDAKAIEILKANLLLIGIVVTGASIFVQTGMAIRPFVNLFTAIGGALLLASTGLAAVTYTASNLRGGLDAAAIEEVIGAPDESAVAFRAQLLRSYARWIEYNARVTAVNDTLATVTVHSVFVAFLYLVAGLGVAALGLSQPVLAAVFVGLTGVVVVFGWIAYNMDHLTTESRSPSGTFAGVRLSKGASRERGLAELRGMIGNRPEAEDE